MTTRPFATLELKTSDPGILYALKQAFIGTFKSRQTSAQVRINREQSRLEFYGNPVDREILTNVLDNAKLHDQNWRSAAHLAFPDAPRGNVKDLEEKIRKLEGEKEQLRIECKGLRNFETQYQDMQQQLGVLKTKYTTLEQEHRSASTRITTLEKSIAQHERLKDSSFTQTALWHIAQYAPRIELLERELGDEITKSQQADTQEAIATLAGIGIESDEDTLKDTITEYLAKPPLLAELYDSQRPAERKLYDEAKAKVQSHEELKATLTQKGNDSHIAATISTILPKIDETIAENGKQMERYERGRESFIESARAALAESLQLIEREEHNELLREIVKDTGCSRIPALITMASEGVSYAIRLYVPVTGERTSGIANALLQEQLLSEEVRTTIPGAIMEMQRKNESEYGLTFYELLLPKEAGANKALQAMQRIERAARAGYANSPFPNLEIGIDIVTSNLINDTPCEPKRAESRASGIETRMGLYQRIQQEHAGKPLRNEAIRALVGGDISRGIINADMRVLEEKGIVTHEGEKRGRTYTFKGDT